jgi:hypothetical protein
MNLGFVLIILCVLNIADYGVASTKDTDHGEFEEIKEGPYYMANNIRDCPKFVCWEGRGCLNLCDTGIFPKNKNM